MVALADHFHHRPGLRVAIHRAVLGRWSAAAASVQRWFGSCPTRDSCADFLDHRSLCQASVISTTIRTTGIDFDDGDGVFCPVPAVVNRG